MDPAGAAGAAVGAAARGGRRDAAVRAFVLAEDHAEPGAPLFAQPEALTSVEAGELGVARARARAEGEKVIPRRVEPAHLTERAAGIEVGLTPHPHGDLGNRGLHPRSTRRDEMRRHESGA